MKFLHRKDPSAQDILRALGRSLAMIEFDPTGNILSANDNFCAALGYEEKEIVGRHHGMFVDPSYASTADYLNFWKKLGQGEFDSGVYKRVAKGGRDVWIQATYNPVLTKSGALKKIVKFATNITASKMTMAENEGKLQAISRCQAVIEFNLNGTIITANQNFLKTMDYDLSEIVGRHHRIFVDPSYGRSAEYEAFWASLEKGEFIAAEFKRFGKGKREIWIQASYNPIFDANGRVFKVVKFATEITERVRAVAKTDAMLKTLLQVMQQIEESADAITNGTEEIRASADSLSKRTEHQAASLEQTAAAMDEITGAVQKTAEGASHAKELVGASRAEAEKSGQVVSRAVEAMNGIEKSSGQIGQIIGVIDEIAFQTNLLALNAGVEAARAGEAGRGFAVVASEVRALAQRSAEAAKEIKALITASTAQVEQGVELVADAGKMLRRIAEQVKDINIIVGDIADAATRQSTGLREVNTAVKQMDQMTQQNAAMVEEATAATHTLANEARVLIEMISRFRADPDTAATMPACSASKHGDTKMSIATPLPVTHLHRYTRRSYSK